MLLANDGHHLNLETVASVLFKMTSLLISLCVEQMRYTFKQKHVFIKYSIYNLSSMLARNLNTV